MTKIKFEDNHVHTTYSDGKNTLEEVLEYNNLRDKLDLVISDHVNKETDWFPKYVKEIKQLRKKYPHFNVKIGCEVKIIDEGGELNTTPEILEACEVVLGSVHHFPNIRKLSKEELLEKEFELTKLLARHKDIDILAHPFGMSACFFKFEPPKEYVKEVYDLCVKNGIKFEFSMKYALETIKNFVKEEIEKGNINNFSFGSDAHVIDEIGLAAFHLAPPVNVLITGAGAGVGQSILKAAKLSKLNKKIVFVDGSARAAGIYRANSGFLVPLAKEKGYVKKIIEVVKKNKIDVIFVGTDTELPVLAENKQKIEKETGARLIISNSNAVLIADDKWKTVEFLKKNGFPYAESALLKDLKKFLKGRKYPLVIKPRIGARSIGFFVVQSEKDLMDKITKVEDPVFQEYLSTADDEFTCSSYFRHGKCLGVLTMQRWLRNGDTYKAIIKKDKKLEEFIEKVGIRLKIEGPCNFQLRKTRKGPVIFEINCRFSGTTGTASFVGYNVVNSILQEIAFGRKPKPLSFKESFMMRYWNEMFVSEDQVKKAEREGFIENPSSELNVF